MHLQTIKNTNLIHPTDVYYWKWNNWFINSEKTYTVHNNARSPGYALCIQWLSEI